MKRKRRALAAITPHQVDQRPVNGHPLLLHPYTSRATTFASGPVHAALPRVPKCQHAETLTVIVSDESGSITSHTAPTTALGNRHGEIRLALQRLGTCSCANELVALTFFDQDPGSTHPRPLTRRGLGRLLADLDAGPAGTSSNLHPTLDVVSNLADQYPSHDLSVIVLSDFLLTDQDAGKVIEDLGDLPVGGLHAISLRANPVDLTGRMSSVDHITHDSAPGAITRALHHKLVRTRGGTGA
jgi:hypothetical protein